MFKIPLPNVFWTSESILKGPSHHFPRNYYFPEIVFFGNHVFQSVSVHFNESALMEILITTVISFYVFINN